MGLTVTHRFASAKVDSSDATLIQPSHWNDSHAVVDSTKVLCSADYNFTASAANGKLTQVNLTAGITNTITLSGMLGSLLNHGVSGVNANHYLYISNGTGTAEKVLITGGTLTATSNSGTLTFVPANNHTGAWTIQSATVGIQEAIFALGASGGKVFVPAGFYDIYAPIRIAGTGYFIQGAGMQCCNVTMMDTGSNNAFEFISATTGQFNGICDIGIIGNNGGSLPTLKSGGAALKFTNQAYLTAKNIYIYAYPFGVNIKDSGFQMYDIHVREVKPTTGIGVYIDGGGAFDNLIYHFTLDASAAYFAGIEIVSAGYVAIDRADIVHADYDLLIDPGTGQFVNTIDVIGSYFDTSYIFGIAILPSGTGMVTRCRFLDCWTASAATAGVLISAGGSTVVDGISFIGHYAPFNTQQGFSIGGATVKNIEIRNSFVFGNSVGSSGTYDGISIASGVDGIKITNTVSSRYGDATNTQSRGLAIAAGVVDVTVLGCDFSENVNGAILDQSTSTIKVIGNNNGVDNVAIATVASGTSIAMPTTDASCIFISGTTTITTITGGWIGRKIRLIKSDAGSVTVGGGGNIPGSHTLAQYGNVELMFDGTNWY